MEQMLEVVSLLYLYNPKKKKKKIEKRKTYTRQNLNTNIIYNINKIEAI